MGASESKNLILSPGAVVNGYEVEESLGSGAFGNVYKVMKEGKAFALKRIDKSAQNFSSVRNEIQSLKISAHENIVKYISVFHDNTAYNIFLEYCEYGSIDNFLKKNLPDEKKRMGFIQDIANGVSHLHHECKIVHRDLKPTNILVDSQCVAKIADFGLAKVFNSKATVEKLYMNTLAGTVAYMAPEVIKLFSNGSEPMPEGQYNSQADIFSMGLIFCSILDDNLKKQVETEMIGIQMNIQPGYKLKLPPTITNLMEDLIIKMLEKNYHDRPTATAVKCHVSLYHEHENT